MDRFELASARYKDLVANHVRDREESQLCARRVGDRLHVWIEQFVLPLATEAFASQQFKDHATWPQRSFQQRSNSDARRLVNEMADALGDSAKLLKRIAGLATIRKAIENEPSSVRLRGITLFETELDRLMYCLRQSEAIERLEWADLVSVDDYFHISARTLATRELVMPRHTSTASAVQLATSCDPSMYLATSQGQGRVGDLVSRGLLARISTWREALQGFRLLLHRAARVNPTKFRTRFEKEGAAWSRVMGLQDQLKTICARAPEARMRESCIALVQVYASFHGASGVDWLELDKHLIDSQRNYLAQLIRSQSDITTTDCIAAALTDVAGLLSSTMPRETAEDAAIRSGALVLIESTRSVYWEGELIDEDWRKNKKSWDLLWALAKKGHHRSEVEMCDVSGELTSASTFTNRWSRLKQQLPTSLSSKVRPGSKPATYLLDLDGQRIHLFAKPEKASSFVLK